MCVCLSNEISGAVLFNLHALDLKVEIQNLLYDLVKEDMVLWKQMRCVEITVALIAETLIELGVSIITQPEEIHWPNGTVSKPNQPTKKKRGAKKAENKNKQGIFGQIVSDLAPKLPKESHGESTGSDEGSQAKQSASKTRSKKTSSKTKKTDSEDFDAHHEGLPAQARNCKFI